MTLGQDLIPNRTVAKLTVPVDNQSELSIRVQLDGKLLIHFNLTGCQRFAQRVHPQIPLRMFLFGFVNNIWSLSRFQRRRICFCMLCSLRYRLIWTPCYNFDELYVCLSAKWLIASRILVSARCLDSQYGTNKTVDSPLTLISRIWQWACGCRFRQWRLLLYDE